MAFETLISMVALAFALHNLEEWIGFDRWANLHPRLDPRLKDRFVFGAALLFLTAVASGVAVAGVCQVPLANDASKVIVVALLFNALSHCAISLKRKCWTPGTYSALFLLLPLTLFSAHSMLQASEMTLSEAFLVCLLSLAILPIAIFGGLWAAYAVKKRLAKAPFFGPGGSISAPPQKAKQKDF